MKAKALLTIRKVNRLVLVLTIFKRIFDIFREIISYPLKKSVCPAIATRAERFHSRG